MREDRERSWMYVRTASICGAGALVFICHALYLECVTEDAFITFRYAQNLVAGHGFVWNVGEHPVEGYTNFLWLLISAAVLGLGGDLLLSSQVIGIVSGLATMLVAYQCGREAGWTPRIAALPCLALAASGPFATWAASGMETNFFTLWVSVGLLATTRFLQNGHNKNAQLLYCAMLLATLTRPEGALIAALLSLAIIGGTWRSGSTQKVRTALPAAIGYAVLVSIYIAWRWNYFDSPLPNTFYAKTGGGIAQVTRGFSYVGLFALHFVAPWLLAFALSFFARSNLDSRSSNDQRPALVGLCLGIVVVYAAYITAVGGDYMAMYRFFVPILPCFYLLVGAAIYRASQTRGSPQTFLITIAIIVGLVGTAFHSTPVESVWVEKPKLMHGNYRGVETERWYVARHKLIGEFFARYGHRGDSLATGAIGAVAYYSGLKVYDVHGITDSHIAHKGKAQGELGTGLPGHEKSDYPYLFAKQPTYYMFSRKLRNEPLSGIPHLVDEVDELVAREYRVGSIRLNDKTNREAGFFSFLERRDRKQQGRQLTPR